MKELDELPGEIKEIESRILGYIFKKSELKKLMDNWEYAEMANIAKEEIKVETNGEKVKHKYPNDIARKAELENRKNISPEYQRMRKDFLDRDNLEKKQQIEFNYKTNRFRAIRKMVDFISSRR